MWLSQLPWLKSLHDSEAQLTWRISPIQPAGIWLRARCGAICTCTWAQQTQVCEMKFLFGTRSSTISILLAVDEACCMRRQDLPSAGGLEGSTEWSILRSAASSRFGGERPRQLKFLIFSWLLSVCY